MRKPVSEKAHYGLGLLVNNGLIPGQTLIGHTGGAYGLTSYMFFQPKEKYGIVIICNGGSGLALKDAINALYEVLIK